MHPLLLISAVVWVLSEVWIFSRDIGKLNFTKDKNSRVIILLFSTIGVIVAFYLRQHTTFYIPSNTLVFLYLGILLMGIGIILRLYSVITLGKYFRTTVMIQKNHRVITHGPYKLIRHPSYSGALLTHFGFGILLGNWLSALALITIPFIALKFRMVVEEDELRLSLGKDYKKYINHTKKLIPFIY